MEKIKIILSDLHLAGGLFLEDGSPNSLENFKFDRELSSLFTHFSKSKKNVEFILNGDILDFLNVESKLDQNTISEVESFKKLKKILRGHKRVFSTLKRVLEKENVSLTYVIGNHDADFHFKSLQKYFKLHLTGDANSDSIKFISEEYYEIEGRVQVHHGHQFEAMHTFNHKNPIIEKDGKKYLKLPWGSLFCLKVINRFKSEHDYVDKVLPHSLFLFASFFNNPLFTIKFSLTTAWYFIKTRIVSIINHQNPFKDIFKLFPDEFKLLDDGEGAGKKILKAEREIHAVIMGHTHYPKIVKYPTGQIYVNTGTWVRMIYLGLKYFGQNSHLPFCLIEYGSDNKPKIRLVEWKYQEGPFRDLVY